MICAIALAAVLSAGAANCERQVELDRFGKTPVAFSLSLEELVSARGEDERYAPCDRAAGDIAFSASCARRASGDAWDASASVTNRCARPRFLRLVFRAAIPFREYSFWNGYLNQGNSEKVTEGSISSLFPAIAAIARDASLVLGLDPTMDAGRVDTTRTKADGREFLEMSFPVYLPPNDSHDICDEDLKDICTTEEVQERMKSCSPFLKVAQKVSTIKVYDYISLAEHAYAKTGNKPFKLKSNKEITINQEEMEELAGLLSANIEAFIEENDVRIDEIPQAFDFNAMSDLVVAFEEYLRKKAIRHNEEEMRKYEESIERTFNRTNFMQEYLEVIKDTANFPLGILWIDDNAVRTEKRIVGGRLKIERKIQAVAERVHPSQIWFTPDYSFSQVGRCVFRVKRFTRGDIMSWAEMNVSGSDKINKNIRKYLDDYTEGCWIPYTMLFRNVNPIMNYEYDVMIARGMFTKAKVEELDIEIPETMKHENYIPCEIYFSGSYVLRARVMDVLDKHLGVFTTVFRRNCTEERTPSALPASVSRFPFHL